MGHVRVVYNGKSYIVDENETIKTLKTVLNIAPEMMLVNERGKRLKDNQRIREAGLKDGEAVMPLLNPEFGSCY